MFNLSKPPEYSSTYRTLWTGLKISSEKFSSAEFIHTRFWLVRETAFAFWAGTYQNTIFTVLQCTVLVLTSLDLTISIWIHFYWKIYKTLWIVLVLLISFIYPADYNYYSAGQFAFYKTIRKLNVSGIIYQEK